MYNSQTKKVIIFPQSKLNDLVSGDTFPVVYNRVLHVALITSRLREFNRPTESYADGTSTLIRLDLKVYTSLVKKISK